MRIQNQGSEVIKTTYICDKCGQEQDKREQFWALGVWASHTGGYHESVVEHKLSIQVCRPCLESFGVHVQKETKAAPAYVERTIEDILRELIERVQP